MRAPSLALAASCLLPAQDVVPAPGEAPEVLAAVPFERAHGLVFVEVGREGEAPLLALLDTGANASAIDARRAADLEVVERVDVLGTTGTLAAEVVELAGLRLDRHALPALRAVRRDLGGLLRPGERPVDLILGSDAFAGAALVLDFRAHELRVERGDADAGGVPLALDEGIPSFEGRLAGLPVSLRIDTGASLFDTPDVYVNVPARVWEQLAQRFPELEPSAHLAGTGASGEQVDLPVFVLPHARLGPREFERVHVIVQPEAGYFARPDAKGFVGNNLLEKLGVVRLDYANGRFSAGG